MNEYRRNRMRYFDDDAITSQIRGLLQMINSQSLYSTSPKLEEYKYAPMWTRTTNLLLRRELLYPIELWEQTKEII